MTKEITKANILQELQDKLKLREFTPEVFSFSECVIPTYDIGQHLRAWETTYTEILVTNAVDPGALTFFTVPDNERWFLRGYNVIFMAAGAYKVTGLYIWRSPLKFIYLDMTLGQTVSYAVNLPVVAVLEPGDKLSVYIDDWISDANLRVYIDYMRETIR